MSNEHTCMSCRFSALWALPETAHGNPPEALVCRRFPPVVVASENGLAPLQPVVDSTWWCGEWAAP